MNFHERQKTAERNMNMKRTHFVAVLIGLAAICILATDASAYYDPGTGRFLSRDPGLDSTMGTPQIATGGPAVGGEFLPRDPINTVNQPNMAIAANTGLARIGSVDGSQPQRSFNGRNPVQGTSYVAGMNLYEYVNANPLSFVDPLGLVRWNPNNDTGSDSYPWGSGPKGDVLANG